MFSKWAPVSKTEIILKQKPIYVGHIEYQNIGFIATCWHPNQMLILIILSFKLNEIGITQ